MTDLSSSGIEFHKHLPINLIDFCPRELCKFEIKILSMAGVMYMDHRILNRIIGKYVWQFVLMINTLNKFENLISVKFRESECIQICIKFDYRNIA